MITHYLSMPLKELERIAYMEQNALALAMLEVCEGEGVDPDDYARLQSELENAQDRVDELEEQYSALWRERNGLLDKLSALEAQFEQACVELRELNLEKQV